MEQLKHDIRVVLERDILGRLHIKVAERACGCIMCVWREAQDRP